MQRFTVSICLITVIVWSVGATLALAQQSSSGPAKSNEDAKWYKGNLHTHTLWSDGDDFPEMVAAWYRDHGYHFLALSDHNILVQGTKWMPLAKIESRAGIEAFPKYQARFGDDWVQTRLSTKSGELEVRLRPLEEVRALVERAGEFLMISSEEITDDHCHMNATNILEYIEPQGGASALAAIQNNLRAVNAQAERIGRMILPHLNHPNLGNKGISAEDLAALVEEEFFEVWNGVDGDGDLGSDRRHSLEALWDITSTLRLTQYNAPPLYALATDDSHDYHGKPRAAPGRGWIVVRSRWLTPESILVAMKKGDFYASTGVELERLEFDHSERTLTLHIKPDGDAQFTTHFIGTPIQYNRATKLHKIPETDEVVSDMQDYSADVGKVFATVIGHTATYQLTGEELYVRATVTSNKPPVDPTTESPYQKAWTQPVGWQIRPEK